MVEAVGLIPAAMNQVSLRHHDIPPYPSIAETLNAPSSSNILWFGPRHFGHHDNSWHSKYQFDAIVNILTLSDFPPRLS